MKQDLQARTRPPSGLTGALAALAMILAHPALGCPACNLAIAEEVVSGLRSGTVVGQDLRRAMENQANLRLEGMGDDFLASAIASKLEAAGGGSGSYADASRSLPLSSAAPGGRADRPSPSTGAPSPRPARREIPAYLAEAPFLEILERDYALPTRPYSTVPQDAPPDRSFTISLQEGQVYLGNGVVYDGFLMDGRIPGQTLVVDEGEVVEMTFENKGMIPHGASIHSAYTQTSKYVGSIGPMTSKSVRFRAMTPGVYMYHCAPGGHAIGMHVLGGQYGMMVVRPKPGSYRLEQELGHGPNLELFLLQHELYASGRDAIRGEPEYTLFNGRLFRYVEEPILTRPGDYVRINFLNVGPNLLSTFHIVGIIWDYIYWQGHPEAMLPGGQTVTAGPSDSFVIEFRMPPDEGAYTMLSHAVGSTNRGAIGLLVVDGKADLDPHRQVMADGPLLPETEMARYRAEATRVISPFGIGTHPQDQPVRFGPEVEEVQVAIIGNSFFPKVIQITPGTRVTWTNEDAFTYLAGEYSGIHNAASISSPPENDGFVGPLLAHGETWSHVFGPEEGTYEYMCTPHPYMRGRVVVQAAEYALGAAAQSAPTALGPWALPLLALCLLLSTASLALRRRS